MVFDVIVIGGGPGLRGRHKRALLGGKLRWWKGPNWEAHVSTLVASRLRLLCTRPTRSMQ